MMMRTMLVIALVLFSLQIANAQGTPECYANFPGAQGKKCCNASFARNARGTLPPDQRMAGLNACMSKAAKK